jgi:hypothetical protein
MQIKDYKYAFLSAPVEDAVEQFESPGFSSSAQVILIGE